jgi:uncharacterized protein DUF5985
VAYRDVISFLSGSVFAGFLACGLFFLRFWSHSRDFLFLAFAGAFWLLALNVAVVVLIPAPDATRGWFYLIRLVAYVLIAIAIVRKNAGGVGDN